MSTSSSALFRAAVDGCSKDNEQLLQQRNIRRREAKKSLKRMRGEDESKESSDEPPSRSRNSRAAAAAAAATVDEHSSDIAIVKPSSPSSSAWPNFAHPWMSYDPSSQRVEQLTINAIEERMNTMTHLQLPPNFVPANAAAAVYVGGSSRLRVPQHIMHLYCNSVYGLTRRRNAVEMKLVDSGVLALDGEEEMKLDVSAATTNVMQAFDQYWQQQYQSSQQQRVQVTAEVRQTYADELKFQLQLDANARRRQQQELEQQRRLSSATASSSIIDDGEHKSNEPAHDDLREQEGAAATLVRNNNSYPTTDSASTPATPFDADTTSTPTTSPFAHAHVVPSDPSKCRSYFLVVANEHKLILGYTLGDKPHQHYWCDSCAAKLTKLTSKCTRCGYDPTDPLDDPDVRYSAFLELFGGREQPTEYSHLLEERVHKLKTDISPFLTHAYAMEQDRIKSETTTTTTTAVTSTPTPSTIQPPPSTFTPTPIIVAPTVESSLVTTLIPAAAADSIQPMLD